MASETKTTYRVVGSGGLERLFGQTYKRMLLDVEGSTEVLSPSEIRAVRRLLARELDAIPAAGKKD